MEKTRVENQKHPLFVKGSKKLREKLCQLATLEKRREAGVLEEGEKESMWRLGRNRTRPSEERTKKERKEKSRTCPTSTLNFEISTKET